MIALFSGSAVIIVRDNAGAFVRSTHETRGLQFHEFRKSYYGVSATDKLPENAFPIFFRMVPDTFNHVFNMITIDDSFALRDMEVLCPMVFRQLGIERLIDNNRIFQNLNDAEAFVVDQFKQWRDLNPSKALKRVHRDLWPKLKDQFDRYQKFVEA